MEKMIPEHVIRGTLRARTADVPEDARNKYVIKQTNFRPNLSLFSGNDDVQSYFD